MSVRIILSPYSTFRKLANENVIEFFPFCVGNSGMVFNFWNIKHLFLSDKRYFHYQNVFSHSSDFLNTSYDNPYFTIKLFKLSSILHECIHGLCAHSMQWQLLKLDHLIFAPSIAAKSDTLACTSPYVYSRKDVLPDKSSECDLTNFRSFYRRLWYL